MKDLRIKNKNDVKIFSVFHDDLVNDFEDLKIVEALPFVWRRSSCCLFSLARGFLVMVLRSWLRIILLKMA